MPEEKEVKKETASEVKVEPKKGTNWLLIIIIILLVVIVIPTAGCMIAGKYVLDKAKDTVKINDSNGTATYSDGNSSVSVSGEDGKNVTWPTDIPTNIPKFTAGDIKGTFVSEGVWSLSIENVKASDVENYKNILISKGFTVEGEVNVVGVISYTAKNSDGYQVTPMFSESESSLILGIAPPVKQD